MTTKYLNGHEFLLNEWTNGIKVNLVMDYVVFSLLTVTETTVVGRAPASHLALGIEPHSLIGIDSLID